MNSRVIIIILALAAPIATLAFMTQQAEVLPKPRENPENNDTKAKMTHSPEKAAAEPFVRQPRPPATLNEAKERLRRKLADLEKMTDEEWSEQQKRKMDEAVGRAQGSRRPWDSMTPEQKIQAMGNQQKAAEAQGRAHEIDVPAAKPEADFPAKADKP